MDEVHPAEMQLTVDPPVPTIAYHAGHQPLRLVPNDGIDARVLVASSLMRKASTSVIGEALTTNNTR